MSSSARKAIFFVLLLVVAYCAYKYMIKPANKALAIKKAEVNKKLIKLAEFEKATRAAKDLGKQLEQLPGIGPADFTPWLAALAKIDYPWYVNPFTHWHVEPDEMAESLAKARDYLKACHAKLG